ncbi:MAG: hypothetical protein WCD81_00525 [Candidatus Bathyarchaeia archaeon]
MVSLLIETHCPQHGYERFRIKVIKKPNVPSEEIKPKFRSRPKPDLSSVIVGRRVTDYQIQEYVGKYLKTTGVWNNIVSMRFIE